MVIKNALTGAEDARQAISRPAGHYPHKKSETREILLHYIFSPIRLLSDCFVNQAVYSAVGRPDLVASP